jgi:predicted dehydrogenase
MSVRIGIVGAGFGSRVVAEVFAATEGCEVVDVVSARDPAVVGALCARPDVDLISIHSPPFLHRLYVEQAIDGGHAVLCDKPFGRNLADAEGMLAAAQAAGVVGLVNFEFRCHPARIQLQALVESGVVGAVEHVHWAAFSSGSRLPLRPYGWLFDRELGGGWIGAWGSHAVDFIRWAVGEVTDASAALHTTITVRPDAEGNEHRCTAEDGFTAVLELDGGISVAIDTSFASPVNLAPRIVISGSDGLLECVGDRTISLRLSDGFRKEIDPPPTPTGGDPHLVPMRVWATEVRDSVRNGAPVPGAPTFVDGVECARVLDRLRTHPL